MDGSLRIGIQTSIAGSYLNAMEAAREVGCNALQVFYASRRMWQGGSARIPEVDAQAFRARRDELRLGPLVIHANYLINLASEQRMLQTRSIQAFHDEIVRAVALGADFLVVHPGARGESTSQQAISTIVESLKQASKRAPLAGLRILIENTAGMGTAVGAGRGVGAETGDDDAGEGRGNVAMLWELAGLKQEAPEAEKSFSMLTAALQKKIAIHKKTEKKRIANAQKKSRAKKSGARKSKTKKKRG